MLFQCTPFLNNIGTYFLVYLLLTNIFVEGSVVHIVIATYIYIYSYIYFQWNV